MEERKYKSGSAYPLQKLFNYYSSPIDLKKTNAKSGLLGWALLASTVIAYDIYAIKSQKVETLTKSFWRLSEGKGSKAPVLGAWLIISFHLMFEKHVRKREQ